MCLSRADCRRVDVEPQRVGKVKNVEVELDAASYVNREGIAAHVVIERLNHVRHEVVQPALPIGTGHDQQPAVAAIKQRGPFARRPIFVGGVAKARGQHDPAIFDRCCGGIVLRFREGRRKGHTRSVCGGVGQYGGESVIRGGRYHPTSVRLQ